jgi:hypothetical protein
MKTYGNIILTAAVIFWVSMALRPAHADMARPGTGVHRVHLGNFGGLRRLARSWWKTRTRSPQRTSKRMVT